MRTITPEIRRALDLHLIAILPQLGLDQRQDIAWANIAFEARPDRIYLRPSIMLSPVESVSCGEDGFEKVEGLYQISIFELQNEGLNRAEDMAAKLVDWFRSGTVLMACNNRLVVTKAYYAQPSFDNVRLHLPVTAAWYCYVQKGK